MIRLFTFQRCLLLVVAGLSASIAADAGDWPMWRCDAARSAASAEELPSELHLNWTRTYSPRVPVWEDPLNQDLMRFDRVFEPIVADGLLFIGFNDSDKVVALDVASGEERWTFYADGPVRLPGVAGDHRVYFVSDDGFMYCLNTADGTLVWKMRGGPQERRILGNSRLITTWPARGGPVLADGTLYFAAGIWPFMGTFIYALDPETGAVKWLNDSDGPTFQEQPHGGAWSFGGVGPQGILVASGDRLLVPGGRSVPAVFDRNTGKLVNYRFHDNNKTGGAFVCAAGSLFFNHYRERVVDLYDIETGDSKAGRLGLYPVVTDEVIYLSGDHVTALDARKVQETPDKWKDAQLWSVEADASRDLIKAGARLYAAGAEAITALQLNEGGEPTVAWKIEAEGIDRLVAAQERLFAVTLDGRIMAFGANGAAATTHAQAQDEAQPPESAQQWASNILDKTGVREGYALCYGVDDAAKLQALALDSELKIIAFVGDETGLAPLRSQLDALGLYGTRIAALQGTPADSLTPPYLASLTIVESEGAIGGEVLEGVFRSMRPYGGKAWIEGQDKAALSALVKQAEAPGLEAAGDSILDRPGPLEGAGQWTHYLGDIAQTGKSDDKRVRLPLGLLWFGGNSHVDVLVRHGHGPPEQVVNGRLFIEGMDCMSARDVYTGRVLWKTELPELDTFGIYYNETYSDTPTVASYNQVHIPGANLRGTNFVVTEDAIYIIHGAECLVLDTITGEKINTFPLGKDETAQGGYIGVYEDYLILGVGFSAFSDIIPIPDGKEKIWANFDYSASKELLVLDRYSGEVQWRAEAEHGFLHNGIAAGKGLLFCLDKVPPYITKQLERRGDSSPRKMGLTAFDIENGKKKWQDKKEVFGSYLCYCEEKDMLLQAMRSSRDAGAGQDGKRIIAYRGKDGKVLWDEPIRYGTFPLLHNEVFVTENRIYDLDTGEPVDRTNPLTGKQESWMWKRMYGCNYPIASEHLLTFRSGAAGYYDFANAGGTGNFGGFKSSCTSNLVVADGVLNAPDYTRTCQCSYPNQTSLALYHDPSTEVWTFNEWDADDDPITRLGLNLGAPGDRLAEDGTLWLEYPILASPSPEISGKFEPEAPRWFLHHSLRFASEAYPWVVASGAEGLTKLNVTLAPGAKDAAPYTITLHFAEPEDVAEGERVFNVTLQGKPVLTDFDITREAGGPRKGIIKAFPDVSIAEGLEVILTPAGSSSKPPLLCGIEIVKKES